ncbi:MAG: 6,7-dimethyl-8-ribityllumazine synthase [Pyrinomonadaceae bacterium]|nr:6,7-dimethyl-8-ribityllumazine synthase [Pyrinomonadaceae bacterium]MCX7640433.1 6,7-dimethyl-8-ribityllumazine synthase [Pyrinomonadaceae bacterium]MDW8304860.1 6,7-dimethyl-8-ribityllumazine synthase [Acidobacteriota bacterium]
MKPRIHKGSLKAEGLRFAIVASCWNDFLTSRLIEGALGGLEKLGVLEEDIEIFRVPGAFEIPLIALKVAESGKFDAIICLGTIIRGETPHFEYVAGETTKGISLVSVKTGIPAIFGIVTADTVEQATNRAGGKAGNKGYEAALAAVEMATLCKLIKENL